MKAKPQRTIISVFGTLTQFIRFLKVNTIGIQLANKVMLIANIVYLAKQHLMNTLDVTLAYLQSDDSCQSENCQSKVAQTTNPSTVGLLDLSNRRIKLVLH